MADCNNCENGGKIYGLSQESHCEHCIHGDKWKKDLYRPKQFYKVDMIEPEITKLSSNKACAAAGLPPWSPDGEALDSQPDAPSGP